MEEYEKYINRIISNIYNELKNNGYSNQMFRWGVGVIKFKEIDTEKLIDDVENIDLKEKDVRINLDVDEDSDTPVLSLILLKNINNVRFEYNTYRDTFIYILFKEEEKKFYIEDIDKKIKKTNGVYELYECLNKYNNIVFKYITNEIENNDFEINKSELFKTIMNYIMIN